MLDAMSAKSARVAEGSSVGGKKNRGTVITVAYVGTFGFAAGGGGGGYLISRIDRRIPVYHIHVAGLIKNRSKHNNKLS